MNEIVNVGPYLKTDSLRRPPMVAGASGDEKQRSGESPERGDQVELSEVGRLLSAAQNVPDVRADKVAAVRSALKQDEGQFIRDRLDATVDRLIESLM